MEELLKQMVHLVSHSELTPEQKSKNIIARLVKSPEKIQKSLKEANPATNDFQNKVRIAIRISLVKVAATSKTEATIKVKKEKVIITIEETTVRISPTNAQLKTDCALKKTNRYSYKG